MQKKTSDVGKVGKVQKVRKVQSFFSAYGQSLRRAICIIHKFTQYEFVPVKGGFSDVLSYSTVRYIEYYQVSHLIAVRKSPPSFGDLLEQLPWRPTAPIAPCGHGIANPSASASSTLYVRWCLHLVWFNSYKWV